MLTEICQELRNWFDRGLPKWYGTFDIIDGQIDSSVSEFLKAGQYYRIVGSLFNDGVHKYTGEADNTLADESFEGAVWSMAVPPFIESLAQKIGAWIDKYGGIDSAAMSPYNSESFGGYSYSKGGGSSDSGGSGADWRRQFARDLDPWRKIL